MLADLVIDAADELKSKEQEAWWKSFENAVANGIGKAFK